MKVEMPAEPLKSRSGGAGAGNVKKALFNNRKRAEKVIEDISFWKDRVIEDFKVVKIGGAADVN